MTEGWDTFLARPKGHAQMAMHKRPCMPFFGNFAWLIKKPRACREAGELECDCQTNNLSKINRNRALPTSCMEHAAEPPRAPRARGRRVRDPGHLGQTRWRKIFWIKIAIFLGRSRAYSLNKRNPPRTTFLSAIFWIKFVIFDPALLWVIIDWCAA